MKRKKMYSTKSLASLQQCDSSLARIFIWPVLLTYKKFTKTSRNNTLSDIAKENLIDPNLVIYKSYKLQEISYKCLIL